ncbi:hypothetical protein [Vibrio parahaemolyticus]|uniref:hypothetical protein n=1 Tax=Vibrio parahaemolyticus TaxID=670 RepID=UPI0015DFA964|nr:hypothetical protein [Vibrio parahaemolyticus]
MKSLLVLSILLIGGCSNYHIEQNSRNGMSSCEEKGSSGNLILKKECTIDLSPKSAK